MTENTPKLTGKLIVPAGNALAYGAAALIAASRITYSPSAWRLARRNGELILQAGSIWTQGRDAGYEWSDVPTVDLGGEANL
jgi:hypothetical protein